MKNTTLTGYVNATGELPTEHFSREELLDLGLVEVDPLTGFYRVSAEGCEHSDAAAWAFTQRKEWSEDLAAFDPSKF